MQIGRNIGLELLATLPPEPSYVALRDLCRDFKLRVEADVRAMLVDLCGQYNIRLVYHRVQFGYGYGVAVTGESWPVVRKLADDYWDREYGDGAVADA